MDSYRRMIRGAIEFVADPRDRRRAGIEAEMHRAGKALDFERAQRLRQRLEAAADFDKPPFRFVDRIEQFRFVAVLPSERVDHARLLLINGGWIEPVADAPIGLSPHELDAVVDAIEKRLEEAPPEFSPDAVQNIGLVCWHLFRPRKARVPGELLPARPGVDRKDLAAAIRKLRRSAPAVGEDESAAAGIAEAEMESAT